MMGSLAGHFVGVLPFILLTLMIMGPTRGPHQQHTPKLLHGTGRPDCWCRGTLESLLPACPAACLHASRPGDECGVSVARAGSIES